MRGISKFSCAVLRDIALLMREPDMPVKSGRGTFFIFINTDLSTSYDSIYYHRQISLSEPAAVAVLITTHVP